MQEHYQKETSPDRSPTQPFPTRFEAEEAQRRAAADQEQDLTWEEEKHA